MYFAHAGYFSRLPNAVAFLSHSSKRNHCRAQITSSLALFQVHCAKRLEPSWTLSPSPADAATVALANEYLLRLWSLSKGSMERGTSAPNSRANSSVATGQAVIETKLLKNR